MKRRTFLIKSALLTSGSLLAPTWPGWGLNGPTTGTVLLTEEELFRVFRNPGSICRPFVRWWWNGNKIEAKELTRELQLLKEAGIGGVEINPIAFPTTGDDLGKKSLTWLSDEWINLLQVTFDEAKKLDMTCDLIVGSGWPFGSESLPREERARVVILSAEKVEGPVRYETSRFNLFKNADPGVTVPCPSRTARILSVFLVPDPVGGLGEAMDYSAKKEDEVIVLEVPPGKFVLYTLVQFDSFAAVINGAPGAAGPILNHMDRAAVRKYLDNMSDTIQKKTGPLSGHLRAFFTDSMELEGCNWTDDLPSEFRKRRGYDLMPWLPFILFKVGRLGAVVEENYGAAKTPAFAEEIKRVRFDFELTKAELLKERFTDNYLQWCRDQQVQSRAQAYGRGFFPLESSLGYDIPEGESWTTNWLKHRIGEEMPDDDYRRGRGYTWINKFVSSAAHLSGRKVVSCEEMTNTYNVFNATLELLKTGSDQSLLSGITHTVWHGFNYSPPEAPFPGWVQYGSYYNENNNWWPYFRYLNQYKARISALLQHSVMYTDIALLPATYDLWSESGVQTDPFPEKLNVPYTSLIWEAIHKTGGAADYTTEIILQQSSVRKGKLCYGAKQYGTLMLIGVTSMYPETLSRLYDFAASGGKIFCLGKYPEKSPGYSQFPENDRLVKEWVEKLKSFPDRFILLKVPDDHKILEWYHGISIRYNIPRYLDITNPDRFVMQNRYRGEDNSEIIFFGNAHRTDSFTSLVTFSQDICRGRYPWIWDPETGERFRLQWKGNGISLELGPAESRILVFSGQKTGPAWKATPSSGPGQRTLDGPWEVEFRHSRENWVKNEQLEVLQDLKDTPFVDFTGTVAYRIRFECETLSPAYLNLGKVYGVSEVFLNGNPCGVKWYGRRIHTISPHLRKGWNDLEIRVVTTMGNYMKTLTGNPTAQKFTVLKTKDQPIQSMGLAGPVSLYYSDEKP